MKPEQTCNGGDGAPGSRRQENTPTAVTPPQDAPGAVDDLANEADANRPTDDSASAEDGLGSPRHLRGEQHPPHATAWLEKGIDSE